MRLARKIAAVVLLCALALVAAGCTDQTADANKAIDAANVQIKKYTQAGSELEQLMSKAESLPMDATNAKKGVALTDEMTGKLDEQRTAAEAARSEIARIEAMKVNDKFKAYAAKEIAVTDALLAEHPVALSLIGDLRKIYELVGSGKATQADIEAVGKRIDTETKQLTDLETKATQLEKAAGDYFEQEKLGQQ